MPCPKCSDTLKRCPDVQSSDCIKYVGDSNECLDFCKGQSVSEVIEQIGTETCTIKTNTDVSTIDLNDYCDDLRDFYISKSYESKTVVNFIDFLLSFDCNLQGQIDAINNSLTNFQSTVTIQSCGCLGEPCAKPSVMNTSDAIQILINANCSQQIEIESLKTTVCQQNKSIQALTNTIGCLIEKLNLLGIEVSSDINFEACQISPNPNPPC